MTVEQGRSGVLRGAVAAAAAELGDRAAPAEQLDMLEIPTRLAEGSVDREKMQRTLTGYHRARGRPEGASNVATKQLREWLLARGQSPLEAMMRWSMHTPETLATELGCTKLEAFDRLKALWGDLAPYLHARMAPVDDQGNAVVPSFNMIFGGAAAAGSAEGLPPWFADPEVRHQLAIEAQKKSEENQGVSDVADAVSHDGSRTDGASD